LIVETGNHYVAQVKGNQPKLFNSIQEAIVKQEPLSFFQEKEKAHGRDTTWDVTVYNARNHQKAEEWKNLTRFIHVHRTCIMKGKVSHSNRLYISDLYHSDAEVFHKGIRGHWGIENRLHHVKDVIHQEDENRIRTKNGPVNMATISSIAINIHRNNGNDSIKDGQMEYRAKIKDEEIKDLLELFRT